MYASLICFKQTFFGDMYFIIHGNTPLELMLHFCQIQDLTSHTMRVQRIIPREDKKASDFIEKFYSKVTQYEEITLPEFRKFMKIGERVCKIIKIVEGDDALERLRKKHHKAYFREFDPKAGIVFNSGCTGDCGCCSGCC